MKIQFQQREPGKQGTPLIVLGKVGVLIDSGGRWCVTVAGGESREVGVDTAYLLYPLLELRLDDVKLGLTACLGEDAKAQTNVYELLATVVRAALIKEESTYWLERSMAWVDSDQVLCELVVDEVKRLRFRQGVAQEIRHRVGRIVKRMQS
ncbi:hypothetical protein [Hydrogenophaga sp. 5NK40-0174]|uniref:hypothetical protein n=1 Tax=Hydrogenophaga sp. 5NK40-0174 TaxID=3127649 RepID=UPI0033401E10